MRYFLLELSYQKKFEEADIINEMSLRTQIKFEIRKGNIIEKFSKTKKIFLFTSTSDFALLL